MFSFLFLHTSLFINAISLSFDLFEPRAALTFVAVTFYLVLEFLFCTFSDAVNAGYR